jgi:phospho-N-acetylmuramoyl-pentapeptide-transferase
LLYHLLYALRYQVSGFNVVHYITFRTAVASLTALFLVLVLGPWMIDRLRAFQIGQYIREEGPQAHKAKAGTPTMGGIPLDGHPGPHALGRPANRNTWVPIFPPWLSIGFADDYLKVVKKNLGCVAAPRCSTRCWWGWPWAPFSLSRVEPTQTTRLIVPFFKNFMPDIGPFCPLSPCWWCGQQRREHDGRPDGSPSAPR